jgi:hypothetical protein
VLPELCLAVTTVQPDTFRRSPVDDQNLGTVVRSTASPKLQLLQLRRDAPVADLRCRKWPSVSIPGCDYEGPTLVGTDDERWRLALQAPAVTDAANREERFIMLIGNKTLPREHPRPRVDQNTNTIL